MSAATLSHIAKIGASDVVSTLDRDPSTLMVAIVIFRAGDGSLSVVSANEYDGDTAAIIHEFDPFQP